jgi:hypothetical protein
MIMQNFDPLHFGIEMIYTLIVILLFLFIYYKTKELYELTKHEGIKYFRLAFIFFSLAYLTRFIFLLFKWTVFSNDYFIPGKYSLPAAFAVVGYFSTIAILYLEYSMLYKKIKYKSFLAYSNIIAITVGMVSYFVTSSIILTFIELPLIILIIWTGLKTKNNAKLLYILISIFWLINLFLLTPKNLFSFEIKIILQSISLIVFMIIIKKAVKWTK